MLIIALAISILGVALLILFVVNNTIAHLIAILGIASAVIFTFVGFSEDIKAISKPLTITDTNVILYDVNGEKVEFAIKDVSQIYVAKPSSKVSIQFITTQGQYNVLVGNISYKWAIKNTLVKKFPKKVQTTQF